MKAKRFSLLAALLFFTISVFGQEEVKNNTVINRSNELGIHAGFTTGLGLSFRHWSNKIGVQITALPLKSNDSQFISGGLTAMYSITNEKYYRFFLYLGNHVYYKTEYSYYNDRIEATTKYNIGFGPGFEAGKNVRFNIMLGYAGYNLLEIPDHSLWPTIEVGLYFKL